MGVYTRLVRPLLFILPPERAKILAEAVLGITPLWKAAGAFLEPKNERLHCHIGGMALPNPIGLAAGYDKDGFLVGRLANLGFGYMVTGTVVGAPRQGNPRPRLIRNREAGSLVNSLGFPSQGLERVLQHLGRTRMQKVPLVASISGLSVEEFSHCYQALQPLVSGVELNISSPNTEGVREFQEPQKFEDLVSTLMPYKGKPLFVKLPPYFDDAHRTRIMQLLDLCIQYSVDGVTAINTWPVTDNRLAVGQGGVSGKPLFPHMLRIVRDIRRHAGPRLIINACGGIFSGEDVLKALVAGANTVQLFTGFVYRGPGAMSEINRYLLRFMAKEGIPSVMQIPMEPIAGLGQ